MRFNPFREFELTAAQGGSVTMRGLLASAGQTDERKTLIDPKTGKPVTIYSETRKHVQGVAWWTEARGTPPQASVFFPGGVAVIVYKVADAKYLTGERRALVRGILARSHNWEITDKESRTKRQGSDTYGVYVGIGASGWGTHAESHLGIMQAMANSEPHPAYLSVNLFTLLSRTRVEHTEGPGGSRDEGGVGGLLWGGDSRGPTAQVAVGQQVFGGYIGPAIEQQG